MHLHEKGDIMFIDDLNGMERLRDLKRGIINAGLEAGFQNSIHFARIFRKT
jgi:hypothetical protein